MPGSQWRGSSGGSWPPNFLWMMEHNDDDYDDDDLVVCFTHSAYLSHPDATYVMADL